MCKYIRCYKIIQLKCIYAYMQATEFAVRFNVIAIASNALMKVCICNVSYLIYKESMHVWTTYMAQNKVRIILVQILQSELKPGQLNLYILHG